MKLDKLSKQEEIELYIDGMLDKFCSKYNISYLDTIQIAKELKRLTEQ